MQLVCYIALTWLRHFTNGNQRSIDEAWCRSCGQDFTQFYHNFDSNGVLGLKESEHFEFVRVVQYDHALSLSGETHLECSAPWDQQFVPTRHKWDKNCGVLNEPSISSPASIPISL